MDQRSVKLDRLPGTQGVPLDLLDDGALWFINSACFHPRGFSLGYSRSEKTFVLFGDGKEPWTMGEAIDSDAKFAAIEAIFAQARLSG